MTYNAIVGVYQSTLNNKKEFPNKSYHTNRKSTLLFFFLHTSLRNGTEYGTWELSMNFT